MYANQRHPIITGLIVLLLIGLHLYVRDPDTNDSALNSDLYCMSPQSFLSVIRQAKDSFHHYKEQYLGKNSKDDDWLSYNWKEYFFPREPPSWDLTDVLPLILSPYTHIQLSHLILNLSALLHYGRLWEKRWGSVRFAWTVFIFGFLICIVEFSLIIGIYRLDKNNIIDLHQYIDIRRLMKSCSVGFSGILYFLMSLDSFATGNYHHPLIALAVTHYTHSNVATAGHIAGVVLGWLMFGRMARFIEE